MSDTGRNYSREKKEAVRAYLNGEKHLVEVWSELASKPWRVWT